MIKQRVGVGGRGKGVGVRVLLAYKAGNTAFFVYGFAKNAMANVSTDELKALKHLAKELLGYDDKVLKQAVDYGELIEVKPHG